MEASGLLDAWLTADGRLRNADTHDVIALPGAQVTRRLGELLVPAIDESDPHARAIPADVIARVLAAVSCAELPDGPYVTSDGRWRLGPLRGAWAKEHAAYIGHGARAAARQRRLAELRALIAEASERRSAAEAAVAACAARQVALESCSNRRRPTTMRAAHATVASAAEAVDAAHTAVDAARTDVDWAERDLAEAVSDRDLAAADTGCPATVAGLRDVAGAVGRFRQAATEFAGALKLHTACLVARPPGRRNSPRRNRSRCDCRMWRVRPRWARRGAAACGDAAREHRRFGAGDEGSSRPCPGPDRAVGAPEEGRR